MLASPLGRADGAADLLGPLRCVRCRRSGSLWCRSCRARAPDPEDPFSIPMVARVTAPFRYEGDARSLVLALKIRGIRDAAVPLADAMAERARREGSAGDVITWVPGRTRDVRRRGFDHARVLAGRFGAVTGRPVRALLAQTGPRADQTALSRVQRRANLSGAFRSARCSGRIVLVDDVVTTGATAEACARALRSAGARAVEVVCACRA